MLIHEINNSKTIIRVTTNIQLSKQKPKKKASFLPNFNHNLIKDIFTT